MNIGSIDLFGMAGSHVGHIWDNNVKRRQKGRARNWWDSPLLRNYAASRISTAHEGGVVGTLKEALGGRSVARGISVGAGDGNKELSLVSAGLVERFHLYELSQVRADLARRKIDKAGFRERMSVHVANAFARVHEDYDLVYWDHALHPMMDVPKAVAWSVEVLKPGGLLLINDYIGPTRLQWSRTEVAFARRFVSEAEILLDRTLPAIRFKTPLSRLRMMLRDPSEAPQSDRIVPACRKLCNGFAPVPIGGAMINICGPTIANASHEDGPAHVLLTEWDRKAEAQGMSHFAFGIWEKRR